MKKIFLALLVITLSTSCKKKYNCVCKTTYLYTSSYYGPGQNTFVSQTIPMNEKMTKKQAQSVCDHEAKTIDETSYNLITGNGAYSSGGSSATTSCLLK